MPRKLGASKKAHFSKAAKAGLTFPPPRVMRKMRHMKLSKRIGAGAAVYMTSVLEYLAAELLEMSGNAARDNKAKRIKPRHMVLAIRNDEEFSKFVGRNTVISNGGILPSIHQALLPKKTKSKKSTTKEAMDMEDDQESEEDLTAPATITTTKTEAPVDDDESDEPKEQQTTVAKPTTKKGSKKKNVAFKEANPEERRILDDDEDDDE